MKKIILKIVTPERVVFEEEVYQVTLPIEEGEVTILPDHIPYIGALKSGGIALRKELNGEEILLATSGGFVEFHENVLMVLSDTAELAEEIDMKRAQEARARAQKAMERSAQLSGEEYAKTAALLEKELARVRVARKHSTKRGIHPDSIS